MDSHKLAKKLLAMKPMPVSLSLTSAVSGQTIMADEDGYLHKVKLSVENDTVVLYAKVKNADFGYFDR